MGKGAGIFESMRGSIQSEEQVALDFMFPTTEKFKRLQMMTHHQMRAMVPLAVLGVFRRKYKSTILKTFQEELGYNEIALDRLGRVEGSEIVAARRIARDKDED